MRRANYYIILMILLAIATGCASGKDLRHRGWIGGEFLTADPAWFAGLTQNYFEKNKGVVPALPQAVKQRQESAILVSRIYARTPAKAGGLQEGDLILAVGNQTVTEISDFRDCIDSHTPGETTQFTVYRDGSIKDLPLVIGREGYKKQGLFKLGFSLSSEFNPIPMPDFTLFSLIHYETRERRLELNSPEFQYFQNAIQQPESHPDAALEARTAASKEGWEFWFLLFGIGRDYIIVSQEPLEAQGNAI